MFCKIILPSNEIHVFPTVPKTFEEFHQMILNKFKDQLSENFSYKYRDSDNELVLLSNDEDLKTAILTAEADKMKNLRIVVVPEQKSHINKNLMSPGTEEALKAKFMPPNPIEEGSAFNNIPLTESITELPPEKAGDSNLGRGGEFTPISETISQFCSPIIDREAIRNNGRFFFNGHDSFGPEVTKDEHNKEGMFNKEQLNLIASIIERSVQKHIVNKLQNILGEAINGLPSAYKQGRNLKGCPVYNYGNILSPFGMRLSSKRCQELAQNDACICQECKGKIKDIRYSCLTCKGYNCCEKCEENVDHPHPLLKIRPSKSSETANTYSEGNNQINKDISKHRGYSDKKSIEESAHENDDVKRPDKLLRNKSTHLSELIDQSIHKENLVNGNAVGHKYQPTNKLLETCDVSEFRTYKVAVIKEPIYDVIRVKSQHNYNVEFTIKNTGVGNWSSRVCFVCINGIHKGEEKEIPHLLAGQEHVVNLVLKAPAEPGRYLSQWKLHHFEESTPKPFGKVIYVEIDVCQGEKEYVPQINKDQTKETLHEDQSKKGVKDKKHKEGEISEKDQELIREMRCSEEALRQAKILNDMFPGDIKEKIEFVNDYPSKRNINDLVSAYLDRLSASCKRRATGGSNLQRTNSVWL